MKFTDSFEHELDNGNTYSIEVEGDVLDDNGILRFDIHNVVAYDDNFSMVDTDHPDFVEIEEEAKTREYDVQVDGRNYDELGGY